MQQESFTEKVIFRLIRKHIAGSTMGAALKKAKVINAKGMPVAMTFLSDSPTAKAKARYIANTYAQLIREMARLGIKSSVHLQLLQIGSGIDMGIAAANLGRLIETGKKYGILVWAEARSDREFVELGKLAGQRGLGVATGSFDGALAYLKRYGKASALKVLCKAERKLNKEELKKMLLRISGSTKLLVLLSPDDEIIDMLGKNADMRKNIILEFQFGYSEKKISKVIKKNKKVSIYMPFGKDWAKYATETVPEGYMRLLAGSLLKESKDNDKKGAKDGAGKRG